MLSEHYFHYSHDEDKLQAMHDSGKPWVWDGPMAG